MTLINPKFIPEKSGIYLVGGTVRDHMLGRQTTDYDLAVDGDPAEVAGSIASAAGSRVVFIGRPEKCVYRIISGNETYDVCGIIGSDINEDLLRRDFTINAMAVNAENGELIDPAGGRKDLSAGLVRMVAPESFDSDPIRLLRAFRMAAVLGFSIDPATLEAISLRTEKITDSAGERIREEWLMLLNSPASVPLLESMDRAGLLDEIFPEIKNLRGCTQNRHHRFDAFEHTMKVCRATEQMLHQNKPALLKDCKNADLLAGPVGPGLVKHAALLHDTGKPLTRSVEENGDIHFYNHEAAGAKMAWEINRRLRFSNAENRYVSFLVENHLRPLFLYLLCKRGKLKPETVSRFFIKTAPWSLDLLILAAADKAGKKSSTNTGFMEFAAKLADDYLNKHLPASKQSPLITGNDLIKHFGLKPSPEFSRILGRIEKMRLAGSLKTRRQALDFTRRLLKKRGQIYF